MSDGRATTEDSGAAGALIGLVTVVLTLVGWTITPLFIEYFTADIDAWTSNGWRYSFAALVWLPLLVVGWRRGTLPPGLWRAALVPSVVNSLAQVCFTMSFYLIDPALVAFGLRAQMVFVTIGAAVLFAHEREVIRSPVFLFGIFLVVGGTGGTVAMSEGFGARTVTGGVLLAIGAGAGFAGYALAVRKCMHHVPSMTAFAAISLQTAIVQFALMLVLGRGSGVGALDLSSSKFAVLLLSAIVGIAAGHVLYYIAIKRLGVAVSSGVIQLQPFTVGLLSLAWFGERLTPIQWLSGSVAVSGAILMLAVQHLRRRAEVRARRQREPAEFAQLPPDVVSAAAAREAVEEPLCGAASADPCRR